MKENQGNPSLFDIRMLFFIYDAISMSFLIFIYIFIQTVLTKYV